MSKLYIVGIGPGNADLMTPAAKTAVSCAEAVCGYQVYLDLLEGMLDGKEIFATPMTKERERCLWAVNRAAEGRTTAVVCSGDAGVYGMAGLVLELAEDREIEIEIVPGVTAAISGAAVLGAPLGHDFCVISLSDLLTPWEQIEKRLRCAAEGDFAIALYNPCSKKRPDHLRRACEILLEVCSPDTVCGWVRNIGRDGQTSRILPLASLREEKLDMFCTVFIGSSATKKAGNYMVTPRLGAAEK